MSKISLALTVVLLLAGTIRAHALEDQQQAAPPPKTPEEIRNDDIMAARGAANTAFTDPSLSSASRLPRLQAILAATRTDTRAELEFGFRSLPMASSELNTGLKLSGPISKDASEAKLATLEGLSDQAKLTFSLRLLTPRPESRFFSGDIFINALKTTWAAENSGKAVPNDIILTDLPPNGQAQVLKDTGLGRGLWLLGLEGVYAAPRTFKFAIPETLANAKEEHDGYSIAGSLGWLPLRQRSPYFFGVTYRREEGYQEQGKRNICTPFGVGGALGCSDIVLGAPAKQTKDLGQVEARLYFHGGELAINPRFTRDFAHDVSGAELPLYFLKDSNGILNGGLAVGWRSDTREYTVSAFVGTMANPFGR